MDDAPYKEGQSYYNVTCRYCGDNIPWFVPEDDAFFASCSVCYKGRNIKKPLGGGSTSSGHWGDDPSGASASWDIVVRAIEEIGG